MILIRMKDNDLRRPDYQRRRLNNWFWRVPVLMAITSLIWFVQKAYKTHFRKIKPKKIVEFVQQEPVIIAPLSSFNVWDTAQFKLGEIPAMVLCVPQPINGGISVESKHFIAFSRICTHLGCPINFNSDLEAIALTSNHRVSNPVLICNCHLSLFDILKAGKVISGPAIEPLPRIQLKVENNQLVAIGIE